MYTAELTINLRIVFRDHLSFPSKVLFQGRLHKTFVLCSAMPEFTFFIFCCIQKNKNRHIKIYSQTSSTHKYFIPLYHLTWSRGRERNRGGGEKPDVRAGRGRKKKTLWKHKVFAILRLWDYIIEIEIPKTKIHNLNVKRVQHILIKSNCFSGLRWQQWIAQIFTIKVSRKMLLNWLQLENNLLFMEQININFICFTQINKHLDKSNITFSLGK